MKKPTTYSSVSSLIFILVLSNQVTSDEMPRMDVGVILDTESWVGRITESCMSMALSDYYSTHNHTTRLVLHTRNSRGRTIDAASSAIDLIKNIQVQAIIGPQSSSQAKFVVDIGNKTQVPIISFTATSPSISFKETPYFIRTALNDSTQVHAIAAIVQAFGWREVVPIYEDTDYGKDMIPYLTDAIQDVNARVPYRSVISPLFTDDQIRGELYKLMTMQTRVFLVHMRASLGSRLFAIAHEVEMMTEGYAWIMTDGLTDLLTTMKASIVYSMQGVLGIKPYVPPSAKLSNFSSRWRRKFLHENPDIDEAETSVFGLWAYDSVWALANAVEIINLAASPRFNKTNDGKNSTDLETLGTSQIGPRLLESILQTKFKGLSGEFWLHDGQLHSSAFQIVNVIGTGGREIGFWSPAFGISSKLDLNGSKTYTVFKEDLRAIIWPGESTAVPKGWEVPTREKKLKIGVPMKGSNTEFVKIVKDPRSHSTLYSGFCIDVFMAVMDSMPYAVPYEFVPFVNDDGQPAGDYNELVNQVYFKKYDGAVGDITIRANRSQHVDFTLPFMESGVSMVVPIKKNDRKNEWIFLKPLSIGLWLTTGAFFIYTGFVIWVLEHQINKDFRGRPSQQVGMIFWFSFSTLAFAHKERVMSNLARFVVIIWVFVVLILTSSYTASLTSRLTVQQLQPTVRDISDLIRNGDYVGHSRSSYIKGLVLSLGFDPKKLRPYRTLEEGHEALSKGSRDGGVSAVMEEIPYIKLFLAKYCKSYMMVGPIHRAAGFGFAFPKGSPLVPDISRALLNVTEGGKMDAFEKKWFGNQIYCQEQEESTITSDNLTLESFKGLFLIAGVSSGAAFLIFLFPFLYEHRDILNSKATILQKFSAMAIRFDSEKDISSRQSKKIGPFDGSATIVRETDAAEFDTRAPPSPATSIFLHDDDIAFSQDGSVSNTEHSTPIRDHHVVIERTSAN